jgi:hypothetical protein
MRDLLMIARQYGFIPQSQPEINLRKPETGETLRVSSSGFHYEHQGLTADGTDVDTLLFIFAMLGGIDVRG